MTREQKDRLLWLRHIMGDGDYGRFFGPADADRHEAELKQLEELERADNISAAVRTIGRERGP